MKFFSRKILSAVLFLTIIARGLYCIADDSLESQIPNDVENLLQTISLETSSPVINSRSAIIFERNSKRVLWGKNETQRRKMASTTKILTAIIVLESANLEDTVNVSAKAASIGGSRLGLTKGATITVNDLLYGLMLCSGNDSAIALAEYTSR